MAAAARLALAGLVATASMLAEAKVVAVVVREVALVPQLRELLAPVQLPLERPGVLCLTCP